MFPSNFYCCVNYIIELLKAKYQVNQIYFSKNEKPYGSTYGQWTVKWWQWAISSPIDMNPLVDSTGQYSGVNQSGPVWFLAGTLGDNNKPVRKCEIPFGKALLFPVINYEINQLEDPELETDDEMIKFVVDDINDIIHREAMIDGVKIPTYRVQSSPKAFFLNFPENNWMGISSGSIKAAADGYWVFLRPPKPGRHDLFFHGSCSAGKRNSTASYILNIVNN